MILRRKNITSVIMLLLLILFAFSSIVSAQTNPVLEEKPLFFVNTNSSMGFGSGGNFGLTVLKQIVRNAGFNFDHGLHPEISDEYLEGISVYFLPTRIVYLLNEEKAALKRFIRGGGVVIINHYAHFANEDTFVKEFGIEYGAVSMGDNYGNIPDESPLSKPNTVNRIRVGYTIALNLPNPAKAIPLAYTESGKIIAAEAIGGSVGKGRLFVMNTMRTFYDGNIAGYVEYVDNKNFIRNLMEHIKGKFDLTLLRVKPKGTNLYSGDKFTCIAKVKNLGDKVSDAVKLEFYITDDGSLEDPSAPQKIKMVKRVDVEPLDPGKSRLIKAEAKLPSWLGAGNYILVAKLDPKGVSDDSQTANNLKVGKKKLKIKE